MKRFVVGLTVVLAGWGSCLPEASAGWLLGWGRCRSGKCYYCTPDAATTAPAATAPATAQNGQYRSYSYDPPSGANAATGAPGGSYAPAPRPAASSKTPNMFRADRKIRGLYD
jgi:hypothetical protein